VIVGLLNNRDSTWADKTQELLNGEVSFHTDLDKFFSDPGHSIFFVNFESVHKVVDRIVKRISSIDLAVVDEAHRISNRTTRQARAIIKLNKAQRRLILTGTPIEKRPTDMFVQMQFVDPSVFGTKWKDFENRYLSFVRVDFKGVRYGSATWSKLILQQAILKRKAEFREERMPEFINKLKPHCLRIEKVDVDIKRAKVEVVSVGLSHAQKKAYRAIDKDKLFKDGAFKSVADFPMTEIMRKRQIAAGFLYDEDQNVYRFKDTPKERKLLELVDKLQKPIVIFTAFRPDTDRVSRILWAEGFDVYKLNGSTPKKKRPELIRQFQKGQCDIFVCQIKAGGVGTDLWKANSAIIYSMGYSFIDWDQALSRLDHHLKKSSSKFFLLSCLNTVDEELYDLVLNKGLAGKAVLDQLKRGTSWPKKNKLLNSNTLSKKSRKRLD